MWVYFSSCDSCVPTHILDDLAYATWTLRCATIHSFFLYKSLMCITDLATFPASGDGRENYLARKTRKLCASLRTTASRPLDTMYGVLAYCEGLEI